MPKTTRRNSAGMFSLIVLWKSDFRMLLCNMGAKIFVYKYDTEAAVSPLCAGHFQRSYKMFQRQTGLYLLRDETRRRGEKTFSQIPEL